MSRKSKVGLEAEVQRQRRSTMRTCFVAIFSSFFCTVSIIMTFLCLFSGNRSPDLWDSPVVSINTTLLGHDSFPTNSSNSAVNIQSTELVIQQWYNLNILSVCEGSYSPSSAVRGAKFGAGSCTFLTPMSHFNLTAHLQHELENSTLSVTLSDLGWPSSIQTQLDFANKYLEASFILYVCALLFLLSTLIPSATVALFTSTYESLVPKISLLSIMACLLTLATTSLTTAYSHLVASTFNIDATLNIYAVQGRHFLVLSWTNAGLTCLVSMVWILEVWLKWSERVRETMRLHQEHYERAKIWGKIGVLEGEEEGPRCSCVDPWKVLDKPRYCGDERKEVKCMREAERARGGTGRDGWTGGDEWIGVEEKVLVLGR